MNSSSKLIEILQDLLLQLPSLLTMLGCIVAAIIRRQRHPKISLTVIISLVLLILITFVFAFVYAFVPDMFRRPGNVSATQIVIIVISFIYNSLWAIALAILLSAIFMQRTTPASPAERSEGLA
jgi:chromate transport protein ChrA